MSNENEELVRRLQSDSGYVAARNIVDGAESADIVDATRLRAMARCLVEAAAALSRTQEAEVEAPQQIYEPPGAGVEMFRRKHGRLPNRRGDSLSLEDRLLLAAQACRAAHLLSCEQTCIEAAALSRSASGPSNADAAELRYWRNVHEFDFRRRDKVDGLSHADRIATLRGN